MLRALVLSDSHRDYYSLERVLRLHPEVEAVFFLGDGEDDFFSPSVQKNLSRSAGNEFLRFTATRAW